MALSDLAVFNEYAYEAKTEVLRQQIALFNAATNGAIVLRAGANEGDYNEAASWKKISGLVKRRNAYGSGAQTPKTLEHIIDRSVKVAAGTPPVSMPPGQFKWIQRNPEEGGAVYGQQLAVDAMADMLNTAILAGAVAIGANANVIVDATAGVANMGTFVTGASKFGDRASDLLCWVMHSKPLFDIYGQSLTNSASLFSFGTINVRQDGFGRNFVVTDSPALMYTSSGQKYRTMGLTSGAITVEENNDFTSNVDTSNGDENIQRTIQAEWTYNMSVKGYAWDKTNGGHSPNDAAIGTGTNWDKWVSDDKDTAGVLIRHQ